MRAGSVFSQNQSSLYTLQYQHQVLKQINDTSFQTLQQNYQIGIFQNAAFVVILVFILFFIPVIASLIFSAFSTKRRTIPPLFMQFVVFSCAVIYFAIHHPFTNLGDQNITLLMPIGMYLLIAGTLQDRFVVWIVGYPSEGMLHYTLKTQSKIRKIKGKLLDEDIKKTLEIYSTIQRDKNDIIFKCRRRSLNMIIQLNSEDNENETLINVVVFEKGMYDIKKPSGKLERYEQQQRAFLESVLSDKDDYVKFDEEVNSITSKQFATEVTEDTKGVYTEMEGITVSSVFKIIMFLTAIGVTIWLLVIPPTKDAGFASLVLVLLYLAFELRDKLGKRKKIA